MKRRKELIDRLRLAVTTDRSESFGELCFEILYGLPQDIQIDFCCYMIDRYLPTFEKRYPNIKWPRKVLSDLDKLIGIVEDCDLDPPEGATMDDSSFIFCFFALKNAYTYRDNMGIFTTSCVCAILSLIYAQTTNAWIKYDPEAFNEWKDQKQLSIKLSDNEHIIEVKEKERNAIIEWLKQNRVWEYPDDADLEMMKKVLEYWKEGEMSLIVPKARKIVEKHQKTNGLSIDDIYTVE